jgi:serine/threonine protein kinase
VNETHVLAHADAERIPLVKEPNAEPIPGYRLVEPLGSGGFGEVWKCQAPGGLTKAIKFVFGNLDSIDGDSAPAEEELRALLLIKDIRHPFLLSLERVEVSGGELAIVMELADKSLQDVLDEHRRTGLAGIPRDQLLNYLREAAEALDVLNLQHGLQHLDVKPGNLFLVGNHIKVADFGLVNSRVAKGAAPPAPSWDRSRRCTPRRRSSAAPSVPIATSTAWPSSTSNCLPRPCPSMVRTPVSCWCSTLARSPTWARCRPPTGPWWPGRWPRIPPGAIPPAATSSAP